MSRFPKLGVNIDHLATLRQLRGTPYPDLLEGSRLVEKAGGDQITIHLREDRRHIQDEDVKVLRKNLKIPLNLEMSVSEEIIRVAIKIKPDWACLVPEKRAEVTTEGGLDVKNNRLKIGRAVQKLKKAGVKVSLFVEPDPRVVRQSREIGADAIEIHTGRYCLATQSRLSQSSHARIKRELVRIKQAAQSALELGLQCHAGHGFDYENVRAIAELETVSREPMVVEYNIGHSIICRAALVGMERAVREMISAIHAP